MKFITTLALAVLIGLPSFAAGLITEDRANLVIERPELVGFGCQGYDQPITASEEDEFPACDAIVRVDQLGNLPKA
jgi:hypothetical protein